MMLPTDPTPASPEGKNIVVFCDGTGNKFIDDPKLKCSNSNVVKLYTAMEHSSRQVAYYHPGLGTAGDPAAKRWIARKWSVIKGLAFGWGFKENVFDAYRYLMETYKHGDRVYLFGFSRGSYTVRALAGLLNGYGLLREGNEGHLPYAWNEYVDQHNDRKKHHVKPNERFKETFSRRGFRIHFMGLWDTVSSVGWVSTPLRLYSVAENPLIDIGRHAVSIDERRCFFRDNLWAGGDNSTLTRHPAVPKQGAVQDLLQIWFAGVHSDVGGGYLQHESVLSNIALDWLIVEAKKAGALISDAMHDLVLGRHKMPTADAEANERIPILEDLFRKPTASIIHKSLHGFWLVMEVLPHRYYDKDDAQENWRTPLGMRRRIPRGSYIHHSVKERIEHKTYKYNPPNLRGALKPFSVPTQDPGSVYLYEPHKDAQPLLNTAPVRIAVMMLVTALDIAAVALVPVAAWWFLRQR